MRTIEIDDDTYVYIASQTTEIGESAADILRRLLDLPRSTDINPTEDGTPHELSEVLQNPKLRYQTAVDKFLYILGEAYKRKSATFNHVLGIQGRDRKYFARSRAEIEESGNSTQPKQIAPSPYWAMTNTSTYKKAALLRQALEAVGYSSEVAREASRLICVFRGN